MSLKKLEIVSETLSGSRIEINKNAYGVEITWTISYISQQSMWRIDVRVDDVIVRRSHFSTSREFMEALYAIGIS